MWAEEPETPEELLMRKDAYEAVLSLTGATRDAMVARLDGHTLADIGVTINRSRERVRQMLIRALREMRNEARVGDVADLRRAAAGGLLAYHIQRVAPVEARSAGSSTTRRRAHSDSVPRAMIPEELAELGNVDVKPPRRADGIGLPFVIRGENPDTRAFFARFDKAYMPPGSVE